MELQAKSIESGDCYMLQYISAFFIESIFRIELYIAKIQIQFYFENNKNSYLLHNFI